ncbi:MAG: BrnT family toxin [Rhodocyclaceae bacterium]|nr:BrnT family toxin [Rhodocyclaceae bacterium]
MPCRTGLTGVGRCTIDGSTSCTEGGRQASDTTIAGPVLRIYNNSDALSYDPAKRDWTLAHRGLDFEDAWLVFSGRTAEVEDIRRDDGELRILCFGMLMGRMVVIGYTQRGAVRHVFSMRKEGVRNFVCEAYHDDEEHVCQAGKRRLRPRPERRGCRPFRRNSLTSS